MNKALIFSLTLAMTSLVGGSAFAQSDPDIRNIRPVVMLLVDTSGSMERMGGGAAAELPVCAGSPAGTNQRNRWTSMVEALTGTWSDASYYCSTVTRDTLPTTAPDYNYYLPHHQLPLGGQNIDGILDVYIDRIKFGLMTFDATYTFTGEHPLLVSESRFLARIGDNIGLPGGYSYGGERPLSYPGCATRFMVDSGSRNEAATEGRLIAIAVDDALDDATNADVQSQLLAVRPFGGTPTAPLLHDLRYYLQNHDSVTGADPFSACRPRFALLLTDGQPDEDFRDARFNCDAVGGCPYEVSADVAADLCRYSGVDGNCEGLLDGVFVVAFDVGDATALAELDSIAAVGGTGSALLASDRDTLMRRIAEVLDRAAPGNTTRSTPAFVTGGSTFSGSGVPTQFEFNAGFHVGDADTPWSGVLERTRYLCNSSMVPEREAPSSRIQFHEELNGQATRRLLTVATPNPEDMDGNLIGTLADSVPLGAAAPSSAVPDQVLTDFNRSNLSHEHFGILTGSTATKDDRREHVISWVNGETPDRVDNRLGDIYHSSPVAVTPPTVDIADESYNLFRRRPEVANRPSVVYVGTNDGILHAFVVENFTDIMTGTTLSAGQELWGFIPPILVPKLEVATASHQVMLDGTAVVKDVFFRRQPGDPANGDIYHTILVMGFRGGAEGYFALDVTDPQDPVFLWQYVGEQPRGGGGGRGGARSVTPLGRSYGVPAIGQVLVEVGGVLQERAFALLPGGAGEEDEDMRSRTTGPVGCPAQGIGQPPVTDGTTTARENQRCWSNTGRVLTWIDMVTGEVISSFDESVFNAPLTGGVAMAPGEVGTLAERAYLTDADGVMWAVDFSSRRSADWEVRPFHDIFWDGDGDDGQPAYHPPIVSVDTEGNYVVLQSTGDIDRLDSSAVNRVVSLTEVADFGSGAPTYSTNMNWEIRLQAGEQVTGALEIFESRVYFASFESGADPSDACQIGQSRIWAVDYLAAGASPPAGYTDVAGGLFPEPGFERTAGAGVYDTFFRGPYSQQLVLGVGITQQPTCLSGAEEFDPYIGTRYRVGDVGGGTFTLTAQISGGPDSGEGAIETHREALPTPQSFTSVAAFAGNVDY